MTEDRRYARHDAVREDRPDGTILLRASTPLGAVARTTGDWLHRWAAETPDQVFLAERSGPGWREATYGETLAQVRALASALLGRGMGAATPIVILSGNSVDHGLLSLAAHYVGIPTVPLAEQYSLIPGAHGRLTEALATFRPAMAFVSDAERFAGALAIDAMKGIEIVATSGGQTPLADLLKGDSADVDAAHAATGPDTVAKILMTSGSTSSPKGVLTTQAMMCTNQAQLAHGLPFLTQHPPRIVDWLPWNHVFGGSHNFNMMLANGGSLYTEA